MITQELYELLLVIDHTGALTKAIEFCNAVYKDYSDTRIKRLASDPDNDTLTFTLGNNYNPDNDPIIIHNSIKMELVEDVVQFLNLHGIYVHGTDSLDLYVSMAWIFIEVENKQGENAEILLDLIYRDDPERTIAEMAGFFSSEYKDEDFFEVIDHIDPFSVMKMEQRLEEITDNEPRSLPVNIIDNIKKFTVENPNNVGMDYLNHGGMVGASSGSYLKIMNIEISEEDIYRGTATLKSVGIDVVSIFIITGHTIVKAKELAIEHISEAMNYGTRDLLSIISYINLVGE